MFLYEKILKLRSNNRDRKQRELILNIILLGSIVLCGAANFFVLYYFIRLGSDHGGASPLVLFIVFLIFIFLYLLSKKGFSTFSSYGLITIYFIFATYSIFTWGMQLPLGLLTYVLIIIISGILISTRFALVVTLVVSSMLIAYVYLLANNTIRPDLSWQSESATIEDALILIFAFGVILLVSWLYNREISKSLKKAHQSEKALQKERDLLDIKVQQKTRELEKAQKEKMQQLHHFAEFGRQASGLFHDLANPLTSVILGVNRMEKFVQAARKQVKKGKEIEKFSLTEEIKQVITILEHKAKENQVEIVFSANDPIDVWIDRAGFNQVVMNLIANAIDVYGKMGDGRREIGDGEKRQVMIDVSKKDSKIILKVQDFGKGISKQNLKKIFEPFFTTKNTKEAIGIGLFNCKSIVEKDLGGVLKVESQEGKGSIFTVEFPVKKRGYGTKHR